MMKAQTVPSLENSAIAWKTLDLVKALLVVGMVWIHSMFWLISDNDTIIDTSSFAYPFVQNLSFIGLLPLCIPIAAGCVLRLHFERFLSNNRLRSYPWGSIVTISLFLVLIGFCINALAFGLRDFFSWDVLGFIALCYLCTVALASVHLYAVFFFALLVLFSTKSVVGLLANHQNYFISTLIGSESQFYWPFFPWFFVFVFGIFIAHVWIQKKYFKTTIACLGGALVLVSISSGSLRPVINPNNLWGLSIFQPGVYFIAGLLGTFCLLILGGEFIGKIRELEWAVKPFSRGILAIYAFHLIIGYRVAPLIKANIPLEPAIVLFPLVMICLSWGVGYLFVKYLYKKKLTIELKRRGAGDG